MTALLANRKQIDQIAAEMRQICSLLFEKTELSYFDYARNYYNGKSFILATDLDYVHYFVNHDCYNSSPPPLITPGQHLWQSYINLGFLHDVQSDFNYDHGITFIRKHIEYEEIFNFASYSVNRKILSVYLNRLEILDQFINYFLDKAANLISNAYKKPIAVINTSSFQQISEFDFTLDLLNEFTKNLKNLKVNNQTIKLTKRESECLNLLLKGYSSKRIARELDISYRTVEIHCDNIRKKTSTNTRLELLLKCKNSNLQLFV